MKLNIITKRMCEKISRDLRTEPGVLQYLKFYEINKNKQRNSNELGVKSEG